MTERRMTGRSTTRPLRATYRLQFHKDFTFADAERRVPYLAALGISHLYASPITMAVPGSTHGYDVADPTRINPELGGEAGFERLAAALAARGMGVLLDIVPNHMAASSHNPYWLALLEFGPASPAARIFDVIWETGRMLLPVLGDPLKATLGQGALGLSLDTGAGRIVVTYADHIFPLRPESVADLLDIAARTRPDLAALAEEWRALPQALDTPASSITSLHTSDSAVGTARQGLTRLAGEDRAAVEAALAQADLPALLAAQHWRLAWWRTAAHDLNYRRFFNITDLAGVRIEDPEVFDLVHGLPLDLVRRGLVDGLRIDHIDGLVDPASYCETLRNSVGPEVPILIEKILEPGEELRDWPIEGTSGYERLNDINGLFIDADAFARFEADLRARHLLIGPLPARLAAAKRQVLTSSLAAEVEVLAKLARDGLDEAMADGDLTEAAIRNAVVALLTHCPVYRSYATREGHDGADLAIWQAIRAGVEANEDPLTNAAAAILLERIAHPTLPSDLEFLLRFQQLSGPAMAKGFEDTELYRVPVLLAVNEVGGSLEHPARDIAYLHDLNEKRAAAGLNDLIPLATHDTKRAPQTRARLAALSFVPDHWLAFVEDVTPLTDPFGADAAGQLMPDAPDRHLILQTLVSAWPISAERIETYLTKALREAKRHTNWETPNEPYEAAALAFARALVEAPEAQPIRDRIESFIKDIAAAETLVSLGSVVLQHTLPGTPDLYQGTEFRDFSLVDPDNRRPVDWEAREAALAGQGGYEQDSTQFALVRALLDLRRTGTALTAGDYRPLAVEPSDWRIFAFERMGGERTVRVAVPTRWPGGEGAPVVAFGEPLEEGWRRLDGEPLSPARRFTLSAERPVFVAIRDAR